jgi:hypothetical protein
MEALSAEQRIVTEYLLDTDEPIQQMHDATIVVLFILPLF